jgi:hypothetical protein
MGNQLIPRQRIEGWITTEGSGGLKSIGFEDLIIRLIV